jgi:hypothetical protein
MCLISDAGGGGERVLWTALRDVQHEFPEVICVVYTGDTDASREQIILKVKVRKQEQCICADCLFYRIGLTLTWILAALPLSISPIDTLLKTGSKQYIVYKATMQSLNLIVIHPQVLSVHSLVSEPSLCFGRL